MIFFMAMPFLTGLINFVVPQQIGARDVAFPYMNAMSLWLTVAGAALVMVSLVIGKFSTAGWTAYPPYSEIAYSPDIGVDYWVWAVLISGVGSTLTGINFIVTILKERAPGMTLMRMPLFMLDGAVHQHPDGLRVSGDHGRRVDARTRPRVRHALLHQRAGRQHDELSPTCSGCGATLRSIS